MGAREPVGTVDPMGLAPESLADRPADKEKTDAVSAVSQVGIEPTTRGLKVPCSTTELLARISLEFTKSPRA